jgi:hypothetical protein
MEERVEVACTAVWDRAVVLGCVGGGRRRPRSHWGMVIPPGLDADRNAFISGRLEEALGWIVKRQHGVNAARLPFAAERTETVVGALPFQECFQVGDVGTLRIDPSKRGAAGGEFFLALAVDKEAVPVRRGPFAPRAMLGAWWRRPLT